MLYGSIKTISDAVHMHTDQFLSPTSRDFPIQSCLHFELELQNILPAGIVTLNPR